MTSALPANRTTEATLSCGAQEKAIVASLDVPFGVVIGNEPQPKSRSLRFFNGTAAALSADVDLGCIGNRTSQAVDDPTPIDNTASATSSTPEPDSSDNAATATFLLTRAAGSAGA